MTHLKPSSGHLLQGAQSSCCEGGLDTVVAEGVQFTFYPVSHPPTQQHPHTGGTHLIML